MVELKKSRYHGDLPNALVEAGIALLQEAGMSGLTLRKAAQRAGVSHAAPAHHFSGLSGILTAIAIEAFKRITATMVRHRDLQTKIPFDRLNGLCDGYIEFAKNHQPLFQVMFNAEEVQRGDPAFVQASQAAYLLLREACLPFSKNNLPDRELEHAVWSTLHGYAMLGMQSKQNPASPRFEAPRFEVHLQRLLQISD